MLRRNMLSSFVSINISYILQDASVRTDSVTRVQISFTPEKLFGVHNIGIWTERAARIQGSSFLIFYVIKYKLSLRIKCERIFEYTIHFYLGMCLKLS